MFPMVLFRSRSRELQTPSMPPGTQSFVLIEALLERSQPVAPPVLGGHSSASSDTARADSRDVCTGNDRPCRSIPTFLRFPSPLHARRHCRPSRGPHRKITARHRSGRRPALAGVSSMPQTVAHDLHVDARSCTPSAAPRCCRQAYCPAKRIGAGALQSRALRRCKSITQRHWRHHHGGSTSERVGGLALRLPPPARF